LFWEIQDKLSEYKSEFYAEEFNILSGLMLESNELSGLSELDIPFYFSLGMSMSKSIKTSKGTDNDDEIDEDDAEN
jgi:CRISPR-associated protein Csh1